MTEVLSITESNFHYTNLTGESQKMEVGSGQWRFWWCPEKALTENGDKESQRTWEKGLAVLGDGRCAPYMLSSRFCSRF